MPAQFVHSPGCVQICFGLPEARASETILVKADTTLDLGRINETHSVYRMVVRDEISASEGFARLEEIIKQEPIYSRKTQFILTILQGFILCGTSFHGSIIDMGVSAVLSLLVAVAQMRASQTQLSSSGAESVHSRICSWSQLTLSFHKCSIFIAGTVSLVARALSSRIPGQIFCYQSISSTSVAGLLPGSLMRTHPHT